MPWFEMLSVTALLRYTYSFSRLYLRLMIGRSRIAMTPTDIVHKVCTACTISANCPASASLTPTAVSYIITALCHGPTPAGLGTTNITVESAKVAKATRCPNSAVKAKAPNVT